MPKRELSRLTVDIPTELHRRAKVFAAEEGKDLRLVVEASLRIFLSGKERGRLSIGQMRPEEADRLAARHPRSKKRGKP